MDGNVNNYLERCALIGVLYIGHRPIESPVWQGRSCSLENVTAADTDAQRTGCGLFVAYLRRKVRFKYTDESADRICAEIANGRSLRQICQDDGMPSRETKCFDWMHAHEDSSLNNTRVRGNSRPTIFSTAWRKSRTEPCRRGYDPKAANVVLSSQQWRAAKLRPKVYGQRRGCRCYCASSRGNGSNRLMPWMAAQYATNRVATAGGSSEALIDCPLPEILFGGARGAGKDRR